MSEMDDLRRKRLEMQRAEAEQQLSENEKEITAFRERCEGLETPVSNV
jgi:hypothetical protein